MDINLFGKYQKAPTKTRNNQRGDLILYFTERLNSGRRADGYKEVTTGYVAFKLTGIPVRDLHFLRSTCDQESKRGVPFGKVFWYSIQEQTKKAHVRQLKKS